MQSQIFAKTTGYNVSNAYKVINTAEIVTQFEREGFNLERVSKQRVKNAAKDGFQKHLLVFRHPSMQFKNVNDSIPEILLKNSYDGSSSFQLMLGIYRMVCSNGLIVGQTFNAIRVRHVGPDVLSKAIQGAFDVAEQVGRAAANIERMQAIQLNHVQRLQFAVQATELIKPENALQFDSSKLLTARRVPDTSNDLWSVFNRVQENIIRGGMRYTTVDANGRVKNASNRSIKAIDRNIEINQKLWTIAEMFAGGAL